MTNNRSLSRQAERAILAQRARDERWAAKARAAVTHPDYGSVVVPHASKFSAICCAAEAWGVDWYEIMDSTVMGTANG